jgi:hypothetical protein
MSGLVVQDFQREFDGLLLGPGTPYRIVPPSAGWLDLPGVRASYTNRARAHGGYVEPMYSGGAVYDLDLNIRATSSQSFNAAVLALEAGTYPQDATRPLWFQLPGHGLRLINVQVQRRSIPVGLEFVRGLVFKAALQFYGPDPLKYAPTLTAPTGLPTSGGGLNWTPGLAYPLNYGTPGNTGQVVCSNPGSAAVSPVLTVVGPIDSQGFQVVSVEEGLVTTYPGSVGAADVFVIDTRTGAATLNGSTRYITYSLMPTIPAAVAGVPGVRTFAFAALGAYSPLASLSVSFAPGYW